MTIQKDYQYIVTEQSFCGERWYHVCDTDTGECLMETVLRSTAYHFCDRLNRESIEDDVCR